MGLLDDISEALPNFLPDDPQQRQAAKMGLLSLGAAMMGARTQNFGRALGEGMQGGLSGYANAYEMAQKTQMQNAQLEASKLGLQKQRMIMDAAQGMLGGGGGGPISGNVLPSQPQSGMGGGAMIPGATGNVLSTMPPFTDAMQSATLGQHPQSGMPGPARSMFGTIPQNLAGYGLLTDPTKLFEIAASQYAPTELQKTMTAAGIDPSSAQGQQMLRDNLAKTNYMAPINMREGATALDPRTLKPLFNAPNKEGIQYSFDDRGVPSAGVVQGFPDALAQFESAKKQGVNRETLAPKDLMPTMRNGQVIPRTIDATIHAAMPIGTESGPQGLDTSKLTPAQMSYLANKDPQAFANGVQDFASTSSAPSAVGTAFGQETTANESAKDTVQNYNEMHKFATTSAQRNIGILQTIHELADKTMTGPGSSKTMFVGGVLNALGLPVGMDATANYQLMTKNLNMLVGSQRMGAAGGGSDALQSLLTASNPNNKEMNATALKEASQELIAYNRMMQAKDRALPNPNTVSAKDYADAETKLTPFSDPRLWQLEHAANDKERIRIMSLIPQGERGALLKKAADARKMGVLN